MSARRFGFRSREALEAADELHYVGHTPIRDVTPRAQVDVSGAITAITRSPVGVPPWLHVQLGDGTGTLDIRFVGRRAIPGMTLGRGLRVSGRAGRAGLRGRLTMASPRYALLDWTAASDTAIGWQDAPPSGR